MWPTETATAPAVGTLARAPSSSKIPKVTAGAYFRSLLEPRRRAEKALHAVVVEAYVKGVSTRKVDDLVRALRIDGISRSEVSRICKVLDTEVRTFLRRPIETECPYLWPTRPSTRSVRRPGDLGRDRRRDRGHRPGQRTIVGAATGQSEDHQFWIAFLRSFIKRGLDAVRLVISDAHEGLRQAIAKILADSTWQRCRVHFMRNLLSTVPKSAQDTVAAIVRCDLLRTRPRLRDGRAARGVEAARAPVPSGRRAARRRGRRRAGAPALPQRAPPATALDQPDRAPAQGGQASDPGGRVFPTLDSLMRMVGTLLAKQDDEWQVADRRYFSVGSMAKVDELEGGEDPKELLAAIA